MTASHSHRFDLNDDGTYTDCIRCGKTHAEYTAERDALDATRMSKPELSEGERYAMDRQRQIVNESRRDRRQFHGGR